VEFHAKLFLAGQAVIGAAQAISGSRNIALFVLPENPSTLTVDSAYADVWRSIAYYLLKT
jgi:hypothetical protein